MGWLLAGPRSLTREEGMNSEEVLATLKKLGKPQTAAIYRRHGSGDHVFGVLTSEIGKLQKKIKVNHALAMELWKTGNAEARVLELQVADPEKLTRSDGALIAVGVFTPALRKKAIEAAKRIGKVEVDHGETNCRTPDAISNIEKASKRKRCP